MGEQQRSAKVLIGKDYRNGKTIRVELRDHTIAALDVIDDYESNSSEDEIVIAPGLVDLQVNGAYGISFTKVADASEISKITEYLWKEGVSTYFPTITSASEATIIKALQSIADTCRKDALLASSIAGIHVESPFISAEDGPRGAQDPSVIRPPDWQEFQLWQEAAEGRIRLITLSPEWPEASEFIRRCVDSGVQVAIGHTAANSAQIAEAVKMGASLSTHLGNGAHLTLPRHPNYIWDQLAEDKLWATFISDGFHLPESLIRVIWKVKDKRALMISDMSILCGNPAARYDLKRNNGHVILTEEGKIHFEHEPGMLAGSAKSLRRCLEHLASLKICSFCDAWDAASVAPASYMNMDAADGLVLGAPANLTLFHQEDGNLRINAVYVDGRKVFDQFST